MAYLCFSEKAPSWKSSQRSIASAACHIFSYSFWPFAPPIMPVRCPWARTKSKLPIDIVAGNRQPSSHVCTQPQTHAFRSGFKSSTNVGAGCSYHPTGCQYHRSTRAPLHPVWQRIASCKLFRGNMHWMKSQSPGPQNRDLGSRPGIETCEGPDGVGCVSDANRWNRVSESADSVFSEPRNFWLSAGGR
jgi:hypothetical protein